MLIINSFFPCINDALFLCLRFVVAVICRRKLPETPRESLGLVMAYDGYEN